MPDPLLLVHCLPDLLEKLCIFPCTVGDYLLASKGLAPVPLSIVAPLSAALEILPLPLVHPIQYLGSVLGLLLLSANFPFVREARVLLVVGVIFSCSCGGILFSFVIYAGIILAPSSLSCQPGGC